MPDEEQTRGTASGHPLEAAHPRLSRPHPWHGLATGPKPPGEITAFIEITPFDLVKYELDKATGYLRVDRPQRSTSLPPTLYGFIPRTYCGQRVAALMPGVLRGDGDPLDVCVISERPISRADLLLTARVVGGLPMCDGGEADDKIIAVLAGDFLWSSVREVSELPDVLVERLHHYFSTYKAIGTRAADVSVGPVYGREHAEAVVLAAMADYQAEFEGA